MKKRNIFALMGLIMILSLTACGGKTKETEAETEAQTIKIETEAETETEETLPEGQMYSFLTGEPVDEAIGMQRPFAIMINNIQDAIPQSGISQADIIYECLVESDITRLMCEFQNIENLTKVGSVRSARHYYMDLADDDAAIYTHYGQSAFAEERMINGYFSINSLHEYSGTTFYRSSDKPAPHNVYTSNDGLLYALECTETDRSYPEGYEGRLNFNTEDIIPEAGDTAEKVTLPFSYNNPWFEYRSEDGLYYRYQYGDAHIDAENNEQLKFKNLIIQYAPCTVISNVGHKDYELFGSGSGLIITDGKAVNITWKRETENDRTTYYYEDGTPAYLNAGKSYIALVPSDTSVTCEAK